VRHGNRGLLSKAFLHHDNAANFLTPSMFRARRRRSHWKRIMPALNERTGISRT
jgi:hypothetical protein